MPLDLRGMRVGCVPYREDCTAPGDRRRFCGYARRRTITFEIARPTESYDLVVLSERADLSVWRRYGFGGAKIVYDLIDSYLAIPRTDIRGLLRGAAKFLSRQSRYPQLSYWRAVEEMCLRADAVVCTTDEQRRDILKFCHNVHIILDLQASDLGATKTSYVASDVFSFVWEGLGTNLGTLDLLSPILRRLSRARPIALHVVTDLTYPAYLGRYGRRSSTARAAKVFDNVTLHRWSPDTLSAVATACDMAVIPIDLDDPFAYGKPENKLLLFWRMGIPAVVSASPAYERAMRACGLRMACRTEEDWYSTLQAYMRSEPLRREAGQRGLQFVHLHHGDDRTLSAWDSVLDSLFAPESNTTNERPARVGP